MRCWRYPTEYYIEQIIMININGTPTSQLNPIHHLYFPFHPISFRSSVTVDFVASLAYLLPFLFLGANRSFTVHPCTIDVKLWELQLHSEQAPSLPPQLILSSCHYSLFIRRISSQQSLEFLLRLYLLIVTSSYLLPSFNMSFAPTLRLHASRIVAPAVLRPPFAFPAVRKIHNFPARQDKPGNYAQTDPQIEVEYPEDHELPSSEPVAGTGGQYVRPTLPTFSLDGHVGIVTGGARGLGLVMGQGMVFSGSNLALVDMNSKRIS